MHIPIQSSRGLGKPRQGQSYIYKYSDDGIWGLHLHKLNIWLWIEIRHEIYS